MQERLLQKKLDEELPERVAERALRDAKVRLAEDVRDIQVIKKWHISAIQSRIVEWQTCAQRAHQVCPYEGEVLFCDEKVKEEQDVLRILDTKESLVKAWYQDKHGLTVFFRSNQKGTMHYMGFGFYSTDVEEKVRSQCLEGRHDFEAQIRVALSAIRTQTQLPVNVLKTIKEYMPDYLEHMKQEKERVEKALRW